MGAMSQVGEAQIPMACTETNSLEDITCCPVTVDRVCSENAGRGVCAAVNFARHSTQTTDVRANWLHYYRFASAVATLVATIAVGASMVTTVQTVQQRKSFLVSQSEISQTKSGRISLIS